MPPYLHIATPAARLQTSTIPYLHAPTPAPNLQSSILPSHRSALRDTVTRCSALWPCNPHQNFPAFRATRANPIKPNRIPYLSHAYSAPSKLPSSIPSHLHARSAPPELPSSIPPRLHAYSAPPELPNSRLHVCTPAAHL